MRFPFVILFCAVIAGCASSSPDYYASPQYTTDANGQPVADGTVPPGQQPATGTTAQTSNSTPVYNQQKPASSEPKPWSNSSATPANAASPSTAQQAKYPLATKVSGKPGIVRSPYAQYAGDVDVRGIAPGTQVRCPYTGKIFIVP
ncbi:MAG: hypothetical protein PHD76_06855 [Methylacidiphilales bacterium]|nr:hypothetical protein [Candidatus Methylacidiphilales bacterium]